MNTVTSRSDLADTIKSQRALHSDKKAGYVDSFLPWLTCVAMLAALAMVFLYVPNERVQGRSAAYFLFPSAVSLDGVSRLLYCGRGECGLLMARQALG